MGGSGGTHIQRRTSVFCHMGVGGVGGDPCDLINLRFCVTTMKTCVEGGGGVGVDGGAL